MSFLGDIGAKVAPSLPSGQNVMTFILFILIAFAVVIILGMIVFAIIWRRKYYMTIQVMSEIDGTIRKDKVYKAMDVRLSRSGDRIIYVRGANRYIPRPIYQSGPNVFLYVITSDDQWINVKMQNIDLERREIRLDYTDKEMRMAHIATERVIEQRYNKKSFWEQYGSLIIYVIFIVLTLAAWVFIVKQQADVASKLASAIDSADKLLQHAVAAQGGSGITPAP